MINKTLVLMIWGVILDGTTNDLFDKNIFSPAENICAASTH